MLDAHTLDILVQDICCTINDAFPTPLSKSEQRQLLRLDVAKAAMQGLLSNNYYMERWSKKEADIELCFEYADALLAEWERTNQ